MKKYSFTAFVRHNDRAFAVELQVQAETLMQAFEEAKKEFALRYSFFRDYIVLFYRGLSGNL